MGYKEYCGTPTTCWREWGIQRKMIKMKMKRINNKKTVIFICSFLGILAFIVITNKIFGFRSPPFSWEETIESLPFVSIGSLGFAAWVTWGGLANELIETFSNSIPKRKKKKNDEKNKK